METSNSGLVPQGAMGFKGCLGSGALADPPRWGNQPGRLIVRANEELSKDCLDKGPLHSALLSYVNT